MKNFNICNTEMKVHTFDSIVIGSGCAGFNAADTLYDLGHRNIALITEGINMGTSRNTGSDKQTYYKMSLCGADKDSAEDMANTLFSGKSVNGDTALVEAACSIRGFMKLVNLGVPFPTNKYGEYVGYMTDHDVRKRATSVGPLTSKYMTEVLEKSVTRKDIKIFDNTVVFKIFKNKDGVVGAAGYDRKEKKFILIRCKNIIMATGGHAQIYENTVYPKSQTGMTGMALDIGAKGANLQEWQYGIASLDFRWNLSGTYQQVIPKYISVDENGVEREFLLDYFEDENDSVNYVFMKGYQWPFDSAKVNGSSMIDMFVYNETVNKNRKVYLDFRSEPKALKNGFDSLSEEAYDYLKNSDALIEKPINRLEKMNKKAIDLYMSHGIDLYNEPLRISVCAQHTNGGIAVDENWESNIKGLYVAGEAAGTFGVYRPGGTALNSTQVGSLRAAEHIAYNKDLRDVISYDEFYDIVNNDIDLPEFTEEKNNTIVEDKNRFAKLMSEGAAYIRNPQKMQELYNKTSEYLLSFKENINKISMDDICDYYKFYDMLITQNAVLKSMIFSAEKCKSRGGSLVMDGEISVGNIKVETNSDYDDKVVYTEYNNGSSDSYALPVREIPKRDHWFESVWNEYIKYTEE